MTQSGEKCTISMYIHKLCTEVFLYELTPLNSEGCFMKGEKYMISGIMSVIKMKYMKYKLPGLWKNGNQKKVFQLDIVILVI